MNAPRRNFVILLAKLRLMRRRSLAVIVASSAAWLIASASVNADSTSATSSLVDWSLDFNASLLGLASNYANFEYTLTDRRVDLPALAARHRAALAKVSSNAERKGVFERMLRELRDPHVSIDWSSDDKTQSPVCGTGLEGNARSPRIAFDRLPEFAALDTEEAQLFRAGVLRTKGSPPIAVLRIGLFVERAFSPACHAAARELGLQTDGQCDEVCAANLDRLSAQWMNQALVGTVRALERQGAKQLVVDITSNSGGSDWAEIVARILAGPLRSNPVAILKHPVWRQYLAARQAELEATLATASAADRKRILRAISIIGAIQKELAGPCDLSAAWDDSALATARTPLPCTTLVTADFFTSGFEAAPINRTPTRIDSLLFHPSKYGAYAQGITRLPLTVLVDRGTHSAAEQFAALLRDNGRAKLVGEVTAGAACGTFTGTGTGFVLPSTGARVRVPDCVRLRADGSNERNGVNPDRLVPWAPSDSAYQRARKTADVLFVKH